jgi:quinol monooxygenase YgiN
MSQQQPEGGIIVMALLKSRPGMGAELKEALAEQIVRMRQEEEGFIQFDLHRSTTDPTVFLLYENWTSEEALRLHFELEHTKQLVKRFDDLLAEPLQVWHLHKIGI